jgi:hypothetical protein
MIIRLCANLGANPDAQEAPQPYTSIAETIETETRWTKWLSSW